MDFNINLVLKINNLVHQKWKEQFKVTAIAFPQKAVPWKGPYQKKHATELYNVDNDWVKKKERDDKKENQSASQSNYISVDLIKT